MDDVLLLAYLHFLAISILYYDWALTLDIEMSSIWRRPVSVSAVFFVLNRYLSIVGNVFITVFNFKKLSLPSCQSYGLFHQLFLVVNQVLVCMLLTIRTWALYGRNIRILLFIIGIAALLLGVASWSLVGQDQTFPIVVGGCHMELSNKTGIHLAVAWEALLGFDSLIFILTLLKTYRVRPRHDFILPKRINIVSLVLRDGAIYYAVMVLANLANILTLYLSSPILKGCLSSFASCISVTMMSRLMLNLHSTASAGIFSTLPSPYPSDGVAFTSRPLDLDFEMHSNDTEYELDVKAPVQSLHARTKYIVQEAGVQEIELVNRDALGQEDVL
ncbi:hypothetical protein PILCRDRAFT_828522 [Piloderma croceum F 1598]|uniref:DUF6533 domain-containing protein n=1 Tax=Piloderma croceum (strain F 1598) TaxID=765440 RepID=A0A0C3AJW2_PILCF|nr:hypothetical protein PILCRDRAFT_828522 [Piloderma croceum F 1598]